MTFHLIAWETQPLVLCHLPYKPRMTSWNKKNLVAMVSSRILMICLKQLLCQGFIESMQFNAAKESIFSMPTMPSHYLNCQVIITRLCSKGSPGGAARLSACCTGYHLAKCIS